MINIMTQELADKLISKYELSISKVIEANSMHEIRNVLLINNTHLGVCNCALMEFNVNLSGDMWVKSKMLLYSNYTTFWLNIPAELHNKEDILKVLRIRLKILKQFPFYIHVF